MFGWRKSTTRTTTTEVENVFAYCQYILQSSNVPFLWISIVRRNSSSSSVLAMLIKKMHNLFNGHPMGNLYIQIHYYSTAICLAIGT